MRERAGALNIGRWATRSHRQTRTMFMNLNMFDDTRDIDLFIGTADTKAAAEKIPPSAPGHGELSSARGRVSSWSPGLERLQDGERRGCRW